MHFDWCQGTSAPTDPLVPPAVSRLDIQAFADAPHERALFNGNARVYRRRWIGVVVIVRKIRYVYLSLL